MKECLQLELTNPCHENWDAMTASEQGRYCGSCRKTVVDFTTMTDREIISYISLYSDGNTCARVHDGQLNRVIQKPPERKHSWKYFWGLALSSLLISYRSVAQQVKPPKGGPVSISKPNDVVIRLGGITASHVKDTIITEVSGRVVNEDGEPIPYASVMLKDPDLSMAADSAGNYSFRIPSDRVVMAALSFSAVGYEPLVSGGMNVHSIKSMEVINKTVKMYMTDFVLKKKEMEQVVVIAYPTIHCRDRVGGLFVSKMEYAKAPNKVKLNVTQKVQELMGRTDVKVYPNPAPANGSFTMQFNLKQTGEYNVQFIDASGRIVGGKQIMIVSSTQTETFEGNHLPGRGMYFVRVAGKDDNKIYNAKLLVQ